MNVRGYYEGYTKVSIAAAVLVISLQGIWGKLLSGLVPKDDVLLATFIEIIISLGIFTIIYELAIALYEKVLWKKALKRINITGKWYLELQVDYGNGNIVSRYGVVSIDQKLGELTLTAYQFSRGNTTKVKNTWTIWNSTFATIDSKGTVQMKYNAQRCASDASDKHAAPSKEGVVELNVICNSMDIPCSMIGSYTEYLPKFTKGLIKLKRTAQNFIPADDLKEINSFYQLNKK